MTADAETQRALAQLATAERFFRQLGTTRELVIEVPDDDQAKADFLDRSGRPFFEITSELSEAVVRGAQERIEDVFTSGEGHASAAEVMSAAAEAARAHLLARFDKQGGDVTLRPLTPAYRAWKAHHGWSALIGIQTGVLRRGLARARITFR